MLLHKRNYRVGYIVILMLCVFLFTPFTASAHHPGIIGPLTHLGMQQIVVVLGASLIDAFNPTAFGVLALLLHQTVSKRKMLKTGFLYLLGILLVYVAAGILLRESYMHGGPTLVLQTVQLVLACMLFYTGLGEIVRTVSDVQLPNFESITKRLGGWVEKGFALPVGVFVGIVELFSTGAIYFSFIQALAFDPHATLEVHAALTALYLVGFLSPLLITLLFVQQASSIVRDVFAGKKKLVSIVIGSILILASMWVAIRAVEGFLLIL